MACGNNFRQIGIANMSYAGDFNDCFIVRADTRPPVSSLGGAGTYDANKPRWFDALLPYVGVTDYGRSMSERNDWVKCRRSTGDEFVLVVPMTGRGIGRASFARQPTACRTL